MQEVFVRAAANARLYELHNPGGYLCRIAKSVLIDRARRRARQIRCIPIGCANEPESAPCQEDGLLEHGLRKEIDGLLATLPYRTQTVFSLSRFGGLRRLRRAARLPRPRWLVPFPRLLRPSGV